jgi:hypothetical protein
VPGTWRDSHLGQKYRSLSSCPEKVYRSASMVTQIVYGLILVGYVAIAVTIPTLVWKRTCGIPEINQRAVAALLAMMWFVFSAGVIAVIRQWEARAPLQFVDILRVAAILSFAAFVHEYERGRK